MRAWLSTQENWGKMNIPLAIVITSFSEILTVVFSPSQVWMVGEWGWGAFRSSCSLTVSFCFTKPAQASWSRASWPCHGIKGFSEGKVVRDEILYLYLGIWFGYMEIGHVIFGKGLSNLSFIKHGFPGRFPVQDPEHIKMRKSWPLFLKGWDRQACVEQTIIQWAWFWDRSMKRCPGDPKKGEKDSNLERKARMISLSDPWIGSLWMRTSHWAEKGEQAGRTA